MQKANAVAAVVAMAWLAAGYLVTAGGRSRGRDPDVRELVPRGGYLASEVWGSQSVTTWAAWWFGFGGSLCEAPIGRVAGRTEAMCGSDSLGHGGGGAVIRLRCRTWKVSRMCRLSQRR
jgi:hypothetical protein